MLNSTQTVMRKKNKDVLNILTNLKKIIENKPSARLMYEEIQMMKFKVKPVKGDIGVFNLKNKRLIEVLWSLGKLDEFFQKEFFHIKPSQREIFFRMFDDIAQRYQLQLNQVTLKKERVEKGGGLEMEIFKEKSLKKLN